jgi:multidrug efflux pump subunit AcrA (membrane-fusion protein)
VNAVLKEVHFKEGDFVKKGDLLFTLDARPFQASAGASPGKSGSRQIPSGASPSFRLSVIRSFTMKVSTAKEQYDQMQANAAAQQGSVHADEAAAESAKLQLQYCAIYSPVDGRTGALQVSAGKLW